MAVTLLLAKTSVSFAKLMPKYSSRVFSSIRLNPLIGQLGFSGNFYKSLHRFNPVAFIYFLFETNLKLRKERLNQCTLRGIMVLKLTLRHHLNRIPSFDLRLNSVMCLTNWHVSIFQAVVRPVALVRWPPVDMDIARFITRSPSVSAHWGSQEISVKMLRK